MADYLLEKRDDVAWLTFDRPARKNAMTFAMTRSLIEALQGLAADRDVRVIAIGGNGADFSAGADVGDMAAGLEEDPVARADGFSQGVATMSLPLMRALLALPQPIVSSVRGHAIGVAMLIVLASDLVVASETAKFTLPQVKLGHTLDHGESMLLPRKVGLGRALQIALLGDRLGAADAERFGMVNWVVGDDLLEPRTTEIVARLAASAPVALAETKALLTRIADADVAEGMALEQAAIRRCAGTRDFVEAMDAFAARRQPVFEGR